MPPLIHIHNLRRSFTVGSETVHALKGITFEVHAGEFISIMGSSGSGKSTLLNILGCLDRPTQGEYHIDNIPVSARTEDELSTIRNRKIGFIFQNYSLLPRTTARQQVELPLLYNNTCTDKHRRARAEQALEQVGLKDRMNHTPNQMSGGQQQRVAIARALAADPLILLADEATGNLDTRTSYEIMSLFQELHAQGKSIIFVTHEPDIATFTQRTIHLSDGQIEHDTPHPPQSALHRLNQLPTKN